MNWTIRDARESDLSELHATCYQHLDRHTFREFAQRSLEWQDHGRGRWLLAIQNERIVGNGQLVAYPTVAELCNLSVVAEARGQGIGAALVAALEAAAPELQRDVVEIGVQADNERAYALYQRLGYHFDRSLMAIPDSSIYILRKRLAPAD